MLLRGRNNILLEYSQRPAPRRHSPKGWEGISTSHPRAGLGKQMDCPYIIYVIALQCDVEANEITAKPYVVWLKRNKIDKYRWKWKGSEPYTKDYGMLTFRFEEEQDKIHFALRWA